MKASEAYALLEANIAGGCVQPDDANDPTCVGLVRRGLMYRATGDNLSAMERKMFAEFILRTFFITDKGRRALSRTKVLAGRVGYNRGDWPKLAEDERAFIDDSIHDFTPADRSDP